MPESRRNRLDDEANDRARAPTTPNRESRWVGALVAGITVAVLGVVFWLVRVQSDPTPPDPTATTTKHDPPPKPTDAEVVEATAARRSYRTDPRPPSADDPTGPPPVEVEPQPNDDDPRLQGEVLADDGTPIAGAAIVLTRPDGRYVERTASAQDGRFAVRRPMPGTARLVVRRTGFVNRTVEVAAERRFVTVRLARTLSLSGVVLDARTGRPIEHYAIEAQRIDDPDADPDAVEPDVLVRVPTTAPELHPRGEFSIADLTPGRYVLVANGPDHLTRNDGPIELRTSLRRTLRLQSGAHIELRIVADRGRPVAGSEVRLERENADEPIQSSSDRAGLVALPALAPGRYDLEVVAEGFATYRDSSFVVTPENSAQTVELKPGGTLSGHVRRTDSGTERLRVTVRHRDGRVTRVAVDPTTHTYRAVGLDPGDYFLDVESVDPHRAGVPPGLARWLARDRRRRPGAHLAPGSDLRVDLVFAPHQFGSLTGRVPDLANTANPGRTRATAELAVDADSSSPLAGLPAGAASYLRSPIDAEGRFRIRWIPAGQYRLRVRSAQRQRIVTERVLEIAPGDNSIEIAELEPPTLDDPTKTDPTESGPGKDDSAKRD